MSRAPALLAELVAIDSVSSRSNAAIVKRLRHEVEALGLSARLHSYVDAAGVEKQNLIVAGGPADGKLGAGGLALVGHTDTVPFDPSWTDALKLREIDGKLYGRGACDTKGFIAAALTALHRVERKRLRKPLVCVFTADEEIGCIGARRVLDDLALRPAHAIVGEPTSLVPVRAHKGYWLAEVEVRGEEGHSSMLRRSAILDAAKLLVRIESVQDELARMRDDDFVPPHTTLNVGTIEGGKAPNVTPARCAFPIEWRPLPGEPGERTEELLRRELESLRSRDPGIEVQFEVRRRQPATATPTDAPIVRWLEVATGNVAKTAAYGTELPFFNAVGAQGCVFGPGDIRFAHRNDEHVPIEELERCADILQGAIEHFCY